MLPELNVLLLLDLRNGGLAREREEVCDDGNEVIDQSVFHELVHELADDRHHIVRELLRLVHLPTSQHTQRRSE